MTRNEVAVKTLEAMKKQFLGETRDILDMAIQALDESKNLDEKVEFMKKMQKATIDDEYDKGFYNGIEYCLALLENREEQYR